MKPSQPPGIDAARACRWALFVSFAALAGGCDHLASPDTPGVAVARIQLAMEGPASVAPGGVLHYRVMATQSGLPPQDVTASAAWASDSPAELRVTAPGTYLASSTRGETNISAVYKDTYTAAHIYVLEDGTFPVRGHVRDGASGIPGAQVTVVAGTGTGLSAISGADGGYALLGVGGTATLTASREGYALGTQTLNVTDQAIADFSLSLVQSRPDVAGAWTLAFTASPSCTGLPDEALQRIYPIAITQRDAVLSLTLTMPQAGYPSFNTVLLNGRLFDRTLSFTLPNDPFDGPAVYEKFDSGSSFFLEGSAAADLNGGTFTGALNGQITFVTPPTPWPGVTCRRSDHRVVLTRAGGSTSSAARD